MITPPSPDQIMELMLWGYARSQQLTQAIQPGYLPQDQARARSKLQEYIRNLWNSLHYLEQIRERMILVGGVKSQK